MRAPLKTLVVTMSWLLALSLSACANGQPSVEDTLPAMWKVRFDEALSDPDLTEFERQVLSDRQVTDSEYQEAVGKFTQCMDDQGWLVSVMPDGSYTVSADLEHGGPVDEVPSPEVSIGCSLGSTNYIMPLYFGLRDNPLGLTNAQAVRMCYEAQSVPDGESLSDDQFSEMLSDPNYHASTPEGVLCFWDPTGSQGLTREQAQSMDLEPRTQITVWVDEADASSGG